MLALVPERITQINLRINSIVALGVKEKPTKKEDTSQLGLGSVIGSKNPWKQLSETLKYKDVYNDPDRVTDLEKLV